jgi:hypothetical protein
MTSTTPGKIVNNGDELNLYSDIAETANPCKISKQVTINGNGYSVHITYPPLQINRGMCNFYGIRFYKTTGTADLVTIQAQHNSILFNGCTFEKGTNYGKLLNDGGTNDLIIFGCTFIKGEYGLYSSNQYVNDVTVNMFTSFENCSKGAYLNRTTSAPVNAWVFDEYDAFQGGNNYCIYSAIAGSVNTYTRFSEGRFWAGGYKTTSYPIYLAGHNDATISENTFYKCTATGTHKAWYNPAGASDNVSLGGSSNEYPPDDPTYYCIQGNVP